MDKFNNVSFGIHCPTFHPTRPQLHPSALQLLVLYAPFSFANRISYYRPGLCLAKLRTICRAYLFRKKSSGIFILTENYCTYNFNCNASSGQKPMNFCFLLKLRNFCLVHAILFTAAFLASQKSVTPSTGKVWSNIARTDHNLNEQTIPVRTIFF
jgi:hypothetical protein